LKLPYKVLSVSAISAVITVSAIATPAFAQDVNNDQPANGQEASTLELNNVSQSAEEESSEVDVAAPNKAPEHLEVVKTIEEPTDEETGAITVANGSTADETLGALAPADGSDQTQEVIGENGEVKEGQTELTTGDQLVVTAEDGTTATYGITVEEDSDNAAEGSSEVDVAAPNKAPEHLEIVKTIEEPTDEETGAITVANGSTADETLGALAPADGSDQTQEVTGENGEVKEGQAELTTGDQLVVTAEDGTTATYGITVEENSDNAAEGSSEVDVAAPNKAPEHLEIVTDIEEPTDEETGAITVANAATVDEALGALAPADGSDQTQEVNGEAKEGQTELVTGDELVVTAEDGTTATYDIIVEDAAQ